MGITEYTLIQMEEAQLESGNINAKWLDNIYENIKNLEALSRLAKLGYQSLLDYLQIPYDQRTVIIGDLKYQNLLSIVVEIGLLLDDLVPVIDEKKINEFRTGLKKVEEVSHDRKLFLNEPSDVNGRIKESKQTPFFEDTLKFLFELKVDIIKEIKNILYVDMRRKKGWE